MKAAAAVLIGMVALGVGPITAQVTITVPSKADSFVTNVYDPITKSFKMLAHGWREIEPSGEDVLTIYHDDATPESAEVRPLCKAPREDGSCVCAELACS